LTLTLKLNRWHLLSLLVFTGLIIFMSGRDYMVHGVHYAYGLQYAQEWHTLDIFIYNGELQFAAFASALIARSAYALVLYEAFVLTCTQDLIFYGLWHNALHIAPQCPTTFPVGDWTWMPLYPTFGAWTTFHQVLLSVSILSATAATITAVNHLRLKYS